MTILRLRHILQGMERPRLGIKAKAIAAGIAVSGGLWTVAQIDRASNPFIMENISGLSDVITAEVSLNDRGHMIARVVTLDERLFLGGVFVATSSVVFVAQNRRKKPQ